MKKFFVMLALAWGTVGAFAQNEADSVAAVNNAVTLAKEVYPQKEEDGDLYHGLTRKLTFDRMIPPYGLEVTYGKTTHIIFPSSVRYVDLGSPNLIAGKADGAENVIRVKTTVKDFREETNMSVITESGSFYTFNVKYADEPLLLNVEMADFVHDGSEVNRPNNALDIYLKELGSESPSWYTLYPRPSTRITDVISSISGARRSASSTCCAVFTPITGCCTFIHKSGTGPTYLMKWIS